MGGDSDGLGDLAWVVVHQRDVGGLDRGVGAGGAHGDAKVRLGEGGCVVDPVADHSHRSGRGDESGDDAQLVVGQQVAAGVVDAGLEGDRGGGALVVPGEHDGGHTECLEIVDSLAAVRAQGVGDREHGERGVVHQHDRCLCLVLEPFQELFEIGSAHAGLLDQTMVAECVGDAIDGAADPATGDRLEPLDGVEGAAVGGDDRVRDRVLGERFDRRGDAQDVVVGERAEIDEIGEHRCSVSERAGLVEGDGAQLSGVLEMDAALDEDPTSGRTTEAGHHRDRGRDHQRARTGEHQQHQPSVEPVVEAAMPGDHRHHCNEDRHHEHRRCVDGGETVDETLRGGLFGLGFLDRACDPVESAFTLGGGDRHLEGAALVDRAGEHRITDRFGDGDRLAGDRCLVHRARSADDATIQRDAFARLHQDHRIQGHLAGGDLHPAAVASHAGNLWCETDERSDRVAGPFQAQRLDQLGDTEQPDDYCRFGPLPDEDRADDSDAHQQAHRHPPGTQRLESLAQRVASAERDRDDRQHGDEHRLFAGTKDHGDFGADGEQTSDDGHDDRSPGQASIERRPLGSNDDSRPHPQLADRGLDRCRRRQIVTNTHPPSDEIELQRPHPGQRRQHRAQIVLLGRAVQLLDPIRDDPDTRRGTRQRGRHRGRHATVVSLHAGHGRAGLVMLMVMVSRHDAHPAHSTCGLARA